MKDMLLRVHVTVQQDDLVHFLYQGIILNL